MKKIILGAITLVLLTSSGLVFAADGSTGSAGSDGSTGSQSSNQTLTKLQNPLKADSVKDIIFLAVDILIYVGTAFAILAVIFVGFMFVMAQGNADKLKEAKMWFFYIIIGLAILISSKVIVEIVKNTLIDSGVVDRTVFELPN